MLQETSRKEECSCDTLGVDSDQELILTSVRCGVHGGIVTETSIDQKVPLELRLLVALAVVAFIVLGVSPEADRFTWLMENLPVILAIPLLILWDSQWDMAVALMGSVTSLLVLSRIHDRHLEGLHAN